MCLMSIDIKEKNGPRALAVVKDSFDSFNHEALSKAKMTSNLAVFIGVLACCYLALASPRPESEADKYEANLLSIMDSLNQKDSIGIYGSIVSLEKTDLEAKSEDRQLEMDPLMKRIDEFLKSHRLTIRFPNDESSADYFGRALGQKNYNFELRGLIQGASEGKIYA